MTRPLVVVMGVSGSGKSTVGAALAEAWQVDFADGDEFHPPDNVARMAAGIPLTDEDRRPWLAAIGEWLWQHRDQGAVAACSALRRSYRDTLRASAPDVWFLHLVVDPDVIGNRMAHRQHHFMPASLLPSQLETLEPLEADERAVVVDAGQPPDVVVQTFIKALA
jgi:gluconokinase